MKLKNKHGLPMPKNKVKQFQINDNNLSIKLEGEQVTIETSGSYICKIHQMEEFMKQLLERSKNGK